VASGNCEVETPTAHAVGIDANSSGLPTGSRQWLEASSLCAFHPFLDFGSTLPLSVLTCWHKLGTKYSQANHWREPVVQSAHQPQLPTA
jgi:hypothetical protein